jgi:hypothetical protein
MKIPVERIVLESIIQELKIERGVNMSQQGMT